MLWFQNIILINYSKMKITTLAIMLLFSFATFAQKGNKTSPFNIMFDYHYNLGLTDRGYLHKSNRSDLKMYGNSIHLTGLYNLNQKWSVGAGLGLDRYENLGYNTFPIFVTSHFSPLEHIPSAYLYTNLGYAVGGEAFTKGMLFDLGLGYKLMLKRHFGFNFQFGYNLKDFRREMRSEERRVGKECRYWCRSRWPPCH